MKFIQHSKKRVNLNNVTQYKAKGDTKIIFNTNGSKYITWRFNSEEARNAVLKDLDEYTEPKDFTPDNHQEESAKVGTHKISF